MRIVVGFVTRGTVGVTGLGPFPFPFFETINSKFRICICWSLYIVTFKVSKLLTTYIYFDGYKMYFACNASKSLLY